MNYEIGFKGPASPELPGLLHGIQWPLNRHGISAEAAADTVDARAPGSAVCPVGQVCPDLPPHRHPDFVLLIVVAVVSFIAGVIFDRVFRKPAVKL